MRSRFYGYRKFFLAALMLLTAAFLVRAAHDYWLLRQAEENIAELRGSLSALEAELVQVKEEKGALAGELEKERTRGGELAAKLEEEENKNAVFEAQIRDISATVGTLQKLSETDRELLKKYSRNYFLNENYVPENLSAIGGRYLYGGGPRLIHSGVRGFLEGMIAAAERDGVSLPVVSAYRSFAEQAAVKAVHEVTYGVGANQFSAEQGYSEHQLGTTVDLTTEGLGGISLEFEDTDAYRWLQNNAYRFGFALSYPKENIYYHFEPWHWRFVGVRLATKLHNEGKFFYELSQREIDEFLVSIFD